MKKRINNWPNVYAKPNRGGSVSYVVDLGTNDDNKRVRSIFKTKAEADAFAQAARTKRENEGLAVFKLPSDFLAEAQKASEILQPFNASILEAARYFVAHLGRYQSAPTVAGAIQELLVELTTNNRRPRTIHDVKVRMEHFAEEFGTRRLSEVSVEDIKRWTANPEWEPRTRINYLTKLSQLFNYGVRQDYIEKNPVDLIKRPTADQTATEILTVAQAEKLLAHAEEFELLPYVVLGLFGGLRSAELLRLKTEAINFEDRVVTVGAKVAKKRAMRHVTMNDALFAWLKKCAPFKTTEIANARSFRNRFDALRRKAGIGNWPNNGLRHSFASYHLALHGDPTKTAGELGHRDPAIVHLHYKALVRKQDAERFWALRPENSSEQASLNSNQEDRPILSPIAKDDATQTTGIDNSKFFATES